MMKQRIIAGFNISCVGDDRAYSYIPSRYGNTLADRVAKNVLRFSAPEYIEYTWLDRGSDERQYCAPGIDLPVCSICRSKYGKYPEYHTSADNLDIISPKGLSGAFLIYQKCIEALEGNHYYKITCLGEPHLSKHGLYSTISKKNQYQGSEAEAIFNLNTYADGKNDLIAISEMISVPVSKLIYIARKLEKAGLLMRSSTAIEN
jgi:aminopeptidase-like protein